MKGVTVWFTGLPCSGKTTLALRLNAELQRRGYAPEALDGDVTRKYLSKGLGFSKEDRDENIRRVGYVCSLLTRHGAITTAAFVSPYRSIRREIRAMIGNFIEVYVKCPVETCAGRDVKGMYQKAMKGEIKNFTGVSDPYEEPKNPEVVCPTDQESVEQSVAKILSKLEESGYVGKTNPHLELPEYLKLGLEKWAGKHSCADAHSFLIQIVSQHIGKLDSGQPEGGQPSEDREQVKEKLKKLGYLS